MTEQIRKGNERLALSNISLRLQLKAAISNGERLQGEVIGLKSALKMANRYTFICLALWFINCLIVCAQEWWK